MEDAALYDVPYLIQSGIAFTIFGIIVTWHALRWRRRNNRKTLLNKTYRSFGLMNIVIGLFNFGCGVYAIYYIK